MVDKEATTYLHKLRIALKKDGLLEYVLFTLHHMHNSWATHHNTCAKLLAIIIAVYVKNCALTTYMLL